MSTLPIHLPLRNEETAISYIRRHSEVLLTDFTSTANQYFLLHEFKNTQNYSLPTGSGIDCEPYLEGLAYQTDLDLIDVFSRMTMFPFLLQFKDEALQGRYIDQIFKTYPEELVPTLASLTEKQECFCPACAKRDQESRLGISSYRIHQVPSVRCCPEHGCLLISASAEEAAEVTPLKAADEEIAFAKFWSEHFDKSLGNAGHISKTIKEWLTASDENKTIEEKIKEILTVAAPLSSDPSRLESLIARIKSNPKSQYLKTDDLMLLVYAADKLGAKNIWSSDQSKPSWDLNPNIEIIAYSEYLVKAKSEGKTYYLHPNHIAENWPLPNGNWVKTDDPVRAIIHSVTNGEYELVSHFESATQPIEIRHKKCGRTMKILFRSFVYEHNRCLCESRLPFEEAKKEIESSGEFELLEFNGTDGKALIKHNTCGRSFEIQYRKFRNRPWCRMCFPSDFSKENFAEVIKNLTGDEYTLLSDYIDTWTPVKLKHNRCGKVVEIAPALFTTGTRCKCTGLIKTEDFISMVDQLSSGEYSIVKTINRNLFEIKNNTTGETKRMAKPKILQELKRPTPSPELPRSIEVNDIQLSCSVEDNVVSCRNFVIDNYQHDEIVFADDLTSVFSSPTVKQTVQIMKKQKLIKDLVFGAYAFMDSDFSDLEIATQKYVVRKKQHIGYPVGESMAYVLGLLPNPPDRFSVNTSKESQLHGRTKHIGSLTLKIHGSPHPVTEENWKHLSVLEFLKQGPKLMKGKDFSEELWLFITDNHLLYEDFGLLCPLYPDWVSKHLKELYKRGGWNVGTQEINDSKA